MMKRLSLFVLALALLVAGPSFARNPATDPCQIRNVFINPDDTANSNEAINLADGTTTVNATWATAFAGEDQFVTTVPLKFSKLRVLLGTAPGAGTSRSITVAWKPTGGTGTLAGSAVTSTTVGSRGSFGCTISGASATTCLDYSGRGITVPANSTVVLRVQNTGAVAAATELGLSFCMTPSDQVGLNN